MQKYTFKNCACEHYLKCQALRVLHLNLHCILLTSQGLWRSRVKYLHLGLASNDPLPDTLELSEDPLPDTLESLVALALSECPLSPPPVLMEVTETFLLKSGGVSFLLNREMTH